MTAAEEQVTSVVPEDQVSIKSSQLSSIEEKPDDEVQAQLETVSAAVDTPPKVVVTDADGNPVSPTPSIDIIFRRKVLTGFRMATMVFALVYIALNMAAIVVAFDSLLNSNTALRTPVSRSLVPRAKQAVWSLVLSSMAIMVGIASTLWIFKSNKAGVGLLSLATTMLALGFYIEGDQWLSLVQAGASLLVAIMAFVYTSLLTVWFTHSINSIKPI